MADGLLNKASIILTPTGYKAGTLYNVAPVVEPYEDFDFARASVASRVNSSGLVEMVGRTLGSELITNGDFSDGTNDWGGNATLSIDNGRLKLSGTSGQTAEQTITATVGKTYKVSYDLTLGTATSGAIIITGGNYPTLDASEGSNTFYSTATSTTFRVRPRLGSNGTIFVDNVSVKEVIDTNNIPRISYDSNGDNGHILLEPTSTNLVGLSEFINPSQSGWSEVATNTYTNNYSTAPDGNQTSTRVQFVNPNSSSQLFYLFNSTSGEYSASIYAKGSGTLKFGFYDNASILTDTITLTSEWQRFEVTKTLQTTSNARFWMYPEGASAATDIEIWGAQAEALSYATSYIPTLTGSTETRATETATGAGSADLINSTEGVLYAEIAALADDGTYRELGLSDGTTSNRVLISFINSTNTIRGNFNGTGGDNLFYTVTDSKDFHKVAVKWKANDFALWVDGLERDTDTSGASFSSNTLNTLKFNSGVTGDKFYGKCKALAVFNEALSDSELTQLTT